MNLLEHYIKKIYSEKDVTSEYEDRIGGKLQERIIRVDMGINCYGVQERVQHVFFESEWKRIKWQGYYFA